MKTTSWHQLTEEEALRKLDASLARLSPSRVSERMARYGKNVLPSRKRLTLFQVIINQFRGSPAAG